MDGAADPAMDGFPDAHPPAVVTAGEVGSAPAKAGEPAIANDAPRWVDHMREVINTRMFIWTLVLASGAAFLAAAANTGNSIKSGAAMGAVLGLWLVVAAVVARRRAEVTFMREYARQRNLKYIGHMELLETSPLLAAGERAYCEHYMEGPLSQDLLNVHFGLGHFTFETYEDAQSKRGNTVEVRTPHDLTICVVEVPEAADVFFGVYLIRRRGVFKSVSGTTWLDFSELRRVELESEALTGRFDLFVRKSQNDENLLRLFKPTFQQWLAELPTELFFEFHQGTLVVYRFKHEDEAVQLDAQIHATASIARELREALK